MSKSKSRELREHTIFANFEKIKMYHIDCSGYTGFRCEAGLYKDLSNNLCFGIVILHTIDNEKYTYSEHFNVNFCHKDNRQSFVEMISIMLITCIQNTHKNTTNTIHNRYNSYLRSFAF